MKKHTCIHLTMEEAKQLLTEVGTDPDGMNAQDILDSFAADGVDKRLKEKHNVELIVLDGYSW